MFLTNFLFSTHLEKGEKIIYAAHRHIFTIWKNLAKIMVLGILIPVAFYLMFPPLKIAWIAWGAIGIIKWFYAIANWYFDAWLITNVSIIDVEWNGFFDKTSTRVEYSALKGVSYAIKGFWGTILNFGHINLELFTSNSVVTLPFAVRPKRIEREILQAQEKFVTSKSFSEHETLKALLTSLLEKHVAGK